MWVEFTKKELGITFNIGQTVGYLILVIGLKSVLALWYYYTSFKKPLFH